MAKVADIKKIEFNDAGRGDGTRTAWVSWQVSTQGGSTFAVDLPLEIKPGEEDRLIPNARAMLHHVMRRLAEETSEWAQPDTDHQPQ